MQGERKLTGEESGYRMEEEREKKQKIVAINIKASSVVLVLVECLNEE